MGGIKSIFFDAYGTLLDTSDGSLKAVKTILDKYNHSIDAAAFYARWKTLHKKHIHSLDSFISEEELFLKDLESLYEEYRIEGHAEKDVMHMLRTLGIRTAYPETIKVLNVLRDNYYLYIASTSDHAPLMSDVRRNGLGVNGVFTSEILRTYKPNRDFYLQLLEKTNTAPSEALFVGDSWDDDVWGPKSVGIRSVWINRKGKPFPKKEASPDFVIEDLEQLCDVLIQLDVNRTNL